MATTIFQWINLAKEIGATHYRIHHIKYHGHRIAYSYAFFNEDDVEIAYHIPGDIFNGLTVLREPRVWSMDFKEHPDYTLHRID